MLEQFSKFHSEQTELYLPDPKLLHFARVARNGGLWDRKFTIFNIFIVFLQNGPRENSASWQTAAALKVSNATKDI